MKNFIQPLSAVLSAVVIIVSCSKEDVNQIPRPTPEPGPIPEGEFSIEIKYDTVNVSEFKSTITFFTQNCKEKPEITIAPEIEGITITATHFEPENNYGTISFNNAIIGNECHDVVIMFRHGGKTVEKKLVLCISTALEDFEFADGTRSVSFKFPEYARIFNVMLKKDYANCRINIPDDAKWISITTAESLKQRSFLMDTNNKDEIRTATITIENPGAKAPLTIEVSQIGSKMKESFKSRLISLYNATDGRNWKNHKNWCSDEPINKWYGVTTSHRALRGNDEIYNGNDNYWELDLSENNLKGVIPDDFWEICDNFEVLDFQSFSSNPNDLTGSILPGKIWHNNLKKIDLQETGIAATIGPDICTAENLEWIDLSGCKLDGAFPEGIGNLTNLTHLVIAYSRYGITGNIPSNLTGLGKLERLDLSYNYNLGGEFDKNFYKMTGLVSFCVNKTKIKGTLSSEIKNLENLQIFDITDCEYRGTIPEEFGLLKNLERVSLAGNYFTNFPEFFRYFAPNNTWQEAIFACEARVQRKIEDGRPEGIIDNDEIRHKYLHILPDQKWFCERYGISTWEGGIPFITPKRPVYPQADDLQHPADEYYYDGTNWVHPKLQYPAREYCFDGNNWVHDPTCPWM